MLSDDGPPAAKATRRDGRRRRHRRTLAIALVSLTAVNFGAAPAGAAAEHSGSPVFGLADFSVVGSSTLVPTEHGVSATLRTSTLTPGDVVTLWWIVFNDPADCEAGMPGLSMCGPQDHLAGRGQVSVLPAAGRVVSGEGTARYGAHLRVGDTSQALEGPGLLDARGAEVILVLKTHGPKIPGLVSEQMSTFAGGCHDQSDVPPGTPPELVGSAGPNDCAEVQVSVHSG